MMVKKLPEKRSKGVQKRHTRRLKTREGYKDVVVNPDVRKDAARSEPLRPRPRAPVESDRRALKPRDSGPKGLALPSSDTRSLRVKVFRGPQDLFDSLESDDWFVDQGVNRGFDILPGILWDEFERLRARNPEVNDYELYERLKQLDLTTFGMDYFGESWAVDVTFFDNSEGELPDTESPAIVTRFYDSTDGLLFGRSGDSRVLKPGFESIPLSTVTIAGWDWKDNADEVVAMAPLRGLNNVRDRGIDARFIRLLRDADIPFMHEAGSVMTTETTDSVIVPSKYFDRAQQLRRQALEEFGEGQ